MSEHEKMNAEAVATLVAALRRGSWHTVIDAARRFGRIGPAVEAAVPSLEAAVSALVTIAWVPKKQQSPIRVADRSGFTLPPDNAQRTVSWVSTWQPVEMEQ